jgi:hypothetical protein
MPVVGIFVFVLHRPPLYAYGHMHWDVEFLTDSRDKDTDLAVNCFCGAKK